MTGVVKNMRVTFATEQLPPELAKEVMAEAEKFIAFLEEKKVTSAPEVRAMTGALLPQINILRGQVMAAEIMERGGAPDEMDAWEKRGLK